MDQRSRKRTRSRSPALVQRPSKDARTQSYREEPRRNEDGYGRGSYESFARQQARRNQAREDEEMKDWVSKEDEFVLKQSKKKALIRVREGRAKPIDWLAVIMSVIDPTRDILEEDSAGLDVEVMDPEAVLDRLIVSELGNIEREIDQYLSLETNGGNRSYWKALKVICKDRQSRLQPNGPFHRGVNAVTADVDKLLLPKTLDQLLSLEGQVNKKLQSNEPIDEDYWEQLLSSIGVYKAKAQLKAIYRSIVESRLKDFRVQQIEQAAKAKSALSKAAFIVELTRAVATVLDPEPELRVRPEDKTLQVIQEFDFLAEVEEEREKIRRLGYVPRRLGKRDTKSSAVVSALGGSPSGATDSRLPSVLNDDHSQATKALYDREVARGVRDDEEVFTGEEEVTTKSKLQWAGQYRPRKPRYFNRVQMGYEWNKYNQTHYDHDNPPPKVVQGYKFNVFYPDLIDKTKAPTYRIERENGRKRGQTFAPAGEEDTCLIRFTSGPPYEDLAFRIVDKEWDYSAKHERGFKSSFDKGILQLHFQFKKVYYRK